ncbi:hypothetical protein GCM10023189_59500 [Nibrella saemangeumensis]|uniref:Uncharacterized protein n=1 Tax=Nibrella saemangeumensis TaxID=1084526 RepID=A0ABP8NRL8_9BACT
MQTFFDQYIDLAVLALCFVFTIINMIRMVRQAAVPVRIVPAILLVFGATAIASFLGFGHLFEISFHAVERMITGTFTFDFRFYSLILLGMVLLSLSVRMLRQITGLFQGVPGSQMAIIKTMVLIVVVSAPTGAFSPIGFVPSIACAISLLGLPFALKGGVAAPIEEEIAVY